MGLNDSDVLWRLYVGVRGHSDGAVVAHLDVWPHGGYDESHTVASVELRRSPEYPVGRRDALVVLRALVAQLEAELAY